MKKIIMKIKKKVTIAKRSASSKGTAGIENKNLRKTVAKIDPCTKFTESDHFTESVEEKLNNLRYNIQRKVRKFH